LETDCYFCMWYMVQWVTLMWNLADSRNANIKQIGEI